MSGFSWGSRLYISTYLPLMKRKRRWQYSCPILFDPKWYTDPKYSNVPPPSPPPLLLPLSLTSPVLPRFPERFFSDPSAGTTFFDPGDVIALIESNGSGSCLILLRLVTVFHEILLFGSLQLWRSVGRFIDSYRTIRASTDNQPRYLHTIFSFATCQITTQPELRIN